MYTVTVDLSGSSPRIWRRLALSSDLDLGVLHRVLQVAMGWTDSHLHAFTTTSGLRLLTDFDIEEGEEGTHERDVRLDQVLRSVGDRLTYEYDFGDGWEHVLVLDAIGPRTAEDRAAECLAGRRACPPEDVGGIHLYNELVAVLEGRATADGADLHEELEWLPVDFDPQELDLAARGDRMDVALLESGSLPGGAALAEPLAELLASANQGGRPLLEELVARAGLTAQPDVSAEVSAHMVRHYVWFLDVLGEDGVRLTSAGYLPPVLVEQTLDRIGRDDWIGKANREDQTWPVLFFRESVLQLRLARKHRGRLLPTVAGRRLRTDPSRLWEHVATYLPVGKDLCERQAGVVALLMAAAAKELEWDLGAAVALVLNAYGWRGDGQPISRHAAIRLAAPTQTVLEVTGAVAAQGGGAAIEQGRALAQAALTVRR